MGENENFIGWQHCIGRIFPYLDSFLSSDRHSIPTWALNFVLIEDEKSSLKKSKTLKMHFS